MDKQDPPAANDNPPTPKAANDNSHNVAANDNQPKGNDLGNVSEKIKPNATPAQNAEAAAQGIKKDYFMKFNVNINNQQPAGNSSGGGGGDDEVSKTIIRKLDLIDRKVSMIEELSKQIKKTIEDHVDLQRKRYEELELQKEEAGGGDGKKAVSCEKCETENKDNPIIQFFKQMNKLKEALIGLVAMLLPMGIKLIKGLIDNVRDKLSEVVKVIEKTLSGAIKGVTSFLSNFVKGLSEGIAFLLDLIPGGIGKGAAAAIRKGGADVAKGIESAGKAVDKYVTDKGEKVAAGLAAPATRNQEKTPLQKPGMAATGAKQATAGQEAQAKVPSISGMDDVKGMIKRHEGLRLEPYKDSVGKWTIGYGHLIGDGSSPGPYAGRKMSQQEADNLFEEDFAHHYNAAKNTPGFDKATTAQKGALIDLAYNMGPAWHKKFTGVSEMLAQGDFAGVGEHLKTSKWYTQVKGRAQEIVGLLSGKGVSTSDNKKEKKEPQLAQNLAASSFSAPPAPTAPATTSAKPTPAPKAPKAVAPPSTVSSEAAASTAQKPTGANMNASKKLPNNKRSNSTQQYIPPPAYHASKEELASVFFMANEPHMGVAGL
jgi:lysozyme